MVGQSAFAASSTDTTNDTNQTTTSTPASTDTTSTSTTTSGGMTSSDNTTTPMGCHGKMIQMMMNSLNLDASQQAKIQAIHDQLKNDQKANWDKLRAIRSQIHDLITSDNFDASKASSLVDEKTAILGTMMKAKITAKNQIYNVLNDQQKTQFKQLMKDMEARWMMRNKDC